MDGTQIAERGTGTGAPAQPPGPATQLPAMLARLWADEAALGLSRRWPELSARNRSFPHLATLLAALSVAAILAAPFQGLSVTGLIAMAASPACLALVGLRLAGVLNRPCHAARRELPDAALPVTSIIVALYREAGVVGHLVQALRAIDYPDGRLEIRLVLEADDEETLEALEDAALDERFRIVIAPPGHPRTKPRALNFALRFCTGDIVAVHDAEDRPHPRQLRRAVESFSLAPPSLACLQAPLNWYNRNETWLTRQFSMEYAAHFHVMLPLYQRLGWPLPLGGTSNYFRGLMYQAHQE